MNKRKRRHKPSADGQSKDPILVSDVKVKEEITEPTNVDNTCRVCLQSGNIPIYGGDEDISGSLQIFGGIEIEPDDKYPKFLCTSCYELLRGAILLRNIAQQSDKLLRQSKSENISDMEVGHSDNDSVHDEKDMDNNFLYHCKTCDIGFNTKKDYEEHRISDEHENRKYTCPVCKKMYSSGYIKSHLALHKMDYSYMCDICGKKFVQQGQFARHRLIHFHHLPYQCALCPYKGRFKEALKMHMRSHTGERPYQCTQCPSRFVSKSNLNKHMHTHKTEHDYKCDACGKGYNTKRDLELHFKVDHNGIKEHVCSECGKAFGYRKQMMKHQLKVHKRQKLRSGRIPIYLQVQSNKGNSEPT